MLPRMPNTPWRGSVQREASARGVVDADRGARLHRVHHHAAVDQLEPRDVGGLGEGGGDLLGVAVVVVERDVARRVVVDERRAGRAASLRPDHGRQRIDVDLDRLGGVLRLQRASRRPRRRSGSPTKRTLSVGSAGRGGLFIGEPSRFLNGTMHLSVP